MGDERCIVKFVERGQLFHPTNILKTILISTNHNPDTRQPMRDEDEADHQKTQDDCAVLGEPLHLLKESCQTDQSCQLEEFNGVKVLLESERSKSDH